MIDLQKELAAAKKAAKKTKATKKSSTVKKKSSAFRPQAFAKEVRDLLTSGDLAAADALRERVSAMSKADMSAAFKAINGVPPKTSLSKKALAHRLHGVIGGNAETVSKRDTINKLTSFGKPAKATPGATAKKSKKADLSDRPVAEVDDEKIGVWTLHHDKTSGGVAAIYGKSVHIFTGKMAKASAVAFAKRHTEKAASGSGAAPADEDKIKSTVAELKRLFEAQPSVEHPGYKHTFGDHGMSAAEVEKRERQLSQHDADHRRNEETYFAFVKSLDDKKYSKEDLQAIFEGVNGYKPPGGKSASKKTVIKLLTGKMATIVQSRMKRIATGGRIAA